MLLNPNQSLFCSFIYPKSKFFDNTDGAVKSLCAYSCRRLWMCLLVADFNCSRSHCILRHCCWHCSLLVLVLV